MKYKFIVAAFLFAPLISRGQMAVTDAGLQTQQTVNHAETLTKWAEQLNKATEQVNKLNDVISNLDNVQGLLGKGMENVGIDPSILSAVDLAKSLNNFGGALQDLQHNSMNTSQSLDRMRSETSDPDAWRRYVVLSKSYDATQKAQSNYDEQMKALDQQRARAQAQLKAAKSLAEKQVAAAALQSVDSAQERLDAERRRAFEQQQANYIENQNQKEAWEQSARDWTLKNASLEGSYSRLDYKPQKSK